MNEDAQDLKQRGPTANFEFLHDTFRAIGTGKIFTPDGLTIIEHHRFEGASDPGDLSVLYGIESANGLRGTIVDSYGTYANADLSEFLKTVKMREDHQECRS